MLERLRIRGIITQRNRLSTNYVKILESLPDLQSEILELTSFLDSSESFQTRIKSILEGIHERPKCKTCGAPLLSRKRSSRLKRNGKVVGLFPNYCNTKCSANNKNVREEFNQTCLERHGVENPRQSKKVDQKIKQTNLDRYGTETPFQSEQIKKKIRKTNLKRWGAEHNWSKESTARAHCEETNLERYGARNVFSSEYGKEKIKTTNMKKYGVKNFKESHYPPEVVEKLTDIEWLTTQHHDQKKTIVKIAEELGISSTALGKRFHRMGIEVLTTNVSQAERDILEFISSIYPGEILTNKRDIIPPHEIDIFFPELNIGIEYNGIFWHSESQGKDRNYHLNKTLKANDQSIRLIQIFENEWLNKPEIVKSRIRNLLGKSERIYARKCQSLKIRGADANDFYEKNHIQGRSRGAHYALIYDNEIVSVMSFDKSRYGAKEQYELIRFANKLNTSVVGGASKLFQRFLKEYDPTSIISYSDKRWNTGGLYLNLGFEFKWVSPPNFYYFQPNDPSTLYSRVKFQKHKLINVLEEFDPTRTEYQNMVHHGFDRIWDCGNDVFVWHSG